MKLSILICHLHSRSTSIEKLLSVLKPQLVDEVEILIESDRGQLSIGAKRNKLLKRSIGDYIAFVDDDDLVSEDYVSKILKAVESNPDCCSLQGEISMTQRIGRRTNNRIRITKPFIHSIQYDRWFEKDKIYYRCPNHLNTIKRELALQVKFPDKDRGEDRDFSTMIFPLLKTEEHIDGTIYFYNAS